MIVRLMKGALFFFLGALRDGVFVMHACIELNWPAAEDMFCLCLSAWEATEEDEEGWGMGRELIHRVSYSM